MNSKAPALLMIIGGLILAASPWVDHLSGLFPPAIGTKHKDAWVVIVEESSERSVAVAQLQSDGAYWKGLTDRGLHWRFYDVDSPDAASYAQPAKDAGLPAVVIASQDGKVLAAKPLPSTMEGLDTLVRKATGL